MYKRSAEGWLKHWDFILLDIICLQIAFIIAYFIRQGIGNPYSDPLYSSEAISFILCQIAVIFFQSVLPGDSQERLLHRVYQDSKACLYGNVSVNGIPVYHTAVK